MLADWRTAPISDREKELLSFIDKVNQASTRIGQGDIDSLKRQGWTEEAIYDAVTVCALFNFYNRWVDATGVPDMPAAAYELSGKRLAEHGYFQGGKMDS